MSKGEVLIYEEMQKYEIKKRVIDIIYDTDPKSDNFNDIEYKQFLKSHPNITKIQMIAKLDHLIKKQNCVPLTYKKALILLEQKENKKKTTTNKFVSNDMNKKHKHMGKTNIGKEKFQKTTSVLNETKTNNGNNLNVFLSKLNIPSIQSIQSMQELMNSLKSENTLEKLSNIPPGLLKKKENILKLLEKKDLYINKFNDTLNKIDTLLLSIKDKSNYINLTEEEKTKLQNIMDIYSQFVTRIQDGIKNAQDKENIFNQMLNQQTNITESDYTKNIDNLESAEQLVIDITDEGIVKLEDEQRKLLTTSNMENKNDVTKNTVSTKTIYIIIIIILLILLYYYYNENQKNKK